MYVAVYDVHERKGRMRHYIEGYQSGCIRDIACLTKIHPCQKYGGLKDLEVQWTIHSFTIDITVQHTLEFKQS